MATGALVALSACSSDSGSAPADTGSAPAEKSSAPPSTTGGSTVGAPPDAEVLGTPRVGEPFTLTIEEDPDDPKPLKLKVTVERVTCGKPIDPAVLAEEAESIGEPTPTPTPESGKEFCVVSLEVANVGKSEAVWDTQSTVLLNVRDTAYNQTQDDYEYVSAYDSYWESRGRTGPVYGLNPGSKGPAFAVFQIPANTPPTTLWVYSKTLGLADEEGTESGYLVRL
ncbi:DUF4352 domain-containing protein [Streptomyces sp. NPDC050315]|uniref:DUF4352 domain-containing protein n=1 Tax=Streptomyces sp. NPDC050315 TaxID=3155039 RepID=UPI003413ED24